MSDAILSADIAASYLVGLNIVTQLCSKCQCTLPVGFHVYFACRTSSGKWFPPPCIACMQSKLRNPVESSKTHESGQAYAFVDHFQHAGVDWSLVAEHVNMDNAYNEFLDPEAAKAQQPGWWDSIKGWMWCCRGRAEGRSAAATPGTVTPHSHGRASGGLMGSIKGFLHDLGTLCIVPWCQHCLHV